MEKTTVDAETRKQLEDIREAVRVIGEKTLTLSYSVQGLVAALVLPYPEVFDRYSEGFQDPKNQSQTTEHASALDEVGRKVQAMLAAMDRPADSLDS